MTSLCEKFNIILDNDAPLRNSNWTTIAPTGSISISADCSPGMEPLFGICYTKNISDSDEKWIFVKPFFEEKYSKESWYQEAISEIVKNGGSCQKVDCVPAEVKRVWVTAHDINWKDRIEMQAALQKNISNAISSTINLPSTATVDEIKEIYMLAWKKGLKGITVYRDGALASQPVEFKQEAKKEDPIAEIRPRIRAGFTHEIMTGHGKVYLTVNKDNSGRIIEIFASGGKNGGVSAANLEAIARLASLALQEGVSVDAISHTLLRINDGTCVWDKLCDDDDRSQQIVSIPDAIAQILQRFYSGAKSETIATTIDVPKQKESNLVCPDCGADAFMAEGCIYCHHCGSKCS